MAVHPLEALSRLFTNWSGEEPLGIIPIGESGSERNYFRLTGKERTAIGVYHPVPEETAAFLAFTRHFKASGLNVPQIYLEDPATSTYLEEDLGDISLFQIINTGQEFSREAHQLMEKSLEALVQFQVVAGNGLDYAKCYPRSSFDAQSVEWDLNYFKYNFLKLFVIFNEQNLEDDFQRLTGYLLSAPSHYFMYRDFQSRNILVKNGSPWFIDYQGGRHGPLAYDVASILFQVKARIPDRHRESLGEFYCRALKSQGVDPDRDFRPFYDAFILVRLLQVLGAYGFRGIIQRKAHFIESIPFALARLKWWLEHAILPIALPELHRSLEKLASIETFPKIIPEADEGGFTVEVSSFSYQQGIPVDYSGHGGGFVFDCRALPNPGREERYRLFTGKDPIVEEFLAKESGVAAFLEHAQRLVDQSVETYLGRNFTRLSVWFGCTGGLHRSVYCAERMARHLRQKFPRISIIICHREIGSNLTP